MGAAWRKLGRHVAGLGHVAWLGGAEQRFARSLLWQGKSRDGWGGIVGRGRGGWWGVR
eukprot:COSAG02_NODE_3873_length_6113_cov_1129.365813_3_plen_58_part_00